MLLFEKNVEIKCLYPSCIFVKTLISFCFAIYRWVATSLLASLPRDQWPEMRVKIAAMDGLNGKRPNWGLNRRWQGNYLSMVNLLYGYSKNTWLRKCSVRWINPMRTTCRLVKMRIWLYTEPITECVRKNSLISKFVMHCNQTCFMIGLRNDQVTI